MRMWISTAVGLLLMTSTADARGFKRGSGHDAACALCPCLPVLCDPVPCIFQFTVTSLEKVETEVELPVRQLKKPTIGTVTDYKIELKPVANVRPVVQQEFKTIPRHFQVPVKVTRLVPCTEVDCTGCAKTTYKTIEETIVENRTRLELVAVDKIVKYETAQLSNEVKVVDRKVELYDCDPIEVVTKKEKVITHRPVTKTYTIPACVSICFSCMPCR